MAGRARAETIRERGGFQGARRAARRDAGGDGALRGRLAGWASASLDNMDTGDEPEVFHERRVISLRPTGSSHGQIPRLTNGHQDLEPSHLPFASEAFPIDVL